MNYDEVKECPHNMLFAIDFFNSEKCLKCKNAMYCELLKEKYKIQNKDEKITLSKARDFINDVWGKVWTYPELIKKNAIKYDLLSKDKENKKQYSWRITYGDIFKLMNIPLWKTLYHGRIHEK